MQSTTSVNRFPLEGKFAEHSTQRHPEGCSIKQVFILDLIKVFVLDPNFLAKITKTLIRAKTKTLTKKIVFDKILS